jgi:hypothetical protein
MAGLSPPKRLSAKAKRNSSNVAAQKAMGFALKAVHHARLRRWRAAETFPTINLALLNRRCHRDTNTRARFSHFGAKR